jgi:uncharacterized protein (DUF1501 family)
MPVLHPFDRRGFLVSGTSLLLLGASAGSAVGQVAEDRKFVFVILRGAMDGLAAVAPYGDPDYAGLRGPLALQPPGGATGVLPLTQGFGLHPRLPFLHSLWRDQRLAIMHAAGTPYRDRSHFDGQDVLESGGSRVFALADGWLNRALGIPSAGKRREAVAVAKTIPLVLRGSVPVKSWSPSNIATAADDTVSRLMDLYAGDALLGPALAQAVETSTIVGKGTAANGMPTGQAYGIGANLQLAQAVARLLATPGGPAAAVFAIDGWDTHANQGAATGQIASRLANLDEVLKSLKDGLGQTWNKTVVVVATEFGRTVAVNGTNGTDHGQGSVALVLGGAVKGGRMIGDWPTLARGRLYEGRDLAPVNDLRGLFSAVLSQHWGIERAALDSRVFPEARGLPLHAGLIAG